jgi:3-phenylpropionate/cinnamic acid dioxygenase small subunit
MRAGAARHNISNIVIKVTGNKAVSRSYWFHYSNDNPKRTGVFDGFGHYEDELAKVKGQWLFTKRRIYNEGRDEWAYKGGKNPAW